MIDPLFRRLGLAAISATLLSGCGGGSSPPAGNASPTWYVSAEAPEGGDGSRARPFSSLQQLEEHSQPGDTLVVLPAPLDIAPLDGGIALKPGQRLLGGGPEVLQHRHGAAVAGAAELSALPRLQNSSVLRLNGDVVRLAEGSEVRNLVITSAMRGAIYGKNVPGAVVQGNDISGYNRLCFVGFTVPRFTAPTRLPYVGIPLILPAGWAGILIDADAGAGELTVNDNYVHHSACGNGIDLRIMQTADYRAEISGNFITELKQGPLGFTQELHLVHAITTQIIDSARLVAHSVNNTQTYIGGPGADCEGLFMNLADDGWGSWTIDRNTFAHGIGGFSCNGMEQVVSHGSPYGEMFISNSSFVDNPGDMIQQDNLGGGSTLVLELDHVVVRDTTERRGSTETAPMPFNLGECILAGSTGPGNTTVLRVRNSDFSNCNGGLTLLSGVSLLNGFGPDGLIDVEIENSRFRGNAVNNLLVGVITPLRELRLKIENSDFGIAGAHAAAFKLLAPGRVETAHIDLGGGALGSRGGNCLLGGAELDAVTQGFAVSLQRNWWGQPGGPAASRVSASQGGSLDLGRPLARAPAICGAS